MLLENRQLWNTVPGKRAASLSILGHCVVLVVVVLLLRMKGPTIVMQQTSAITLAAKGSPLAFNSVKAEPVQTHTRSLLHASKRLRLRREAKTMGENGTVEMIRDHAKRETAGLMMSLRQRLTYGIPITDYQFAVQTSGVVPIIPASDLPPRYEQYLVVEITVDTDGTVADARIVTGQVDQKVQKKLLSAIREFKYTPAKHNGAPIPSQLDLVVHVPS
jgi:TonB family protein